MTRIQKTIDEVSNRGRPAWALPAAMALALIAVAAFFSCSPGFVARAAWEEAQILWNRQPFEDVLNDAGLDMETRSKLELVVQARSFARRDLKLDVGNSYTSFTRLDRDTLALVLSASPIDELAAYTWWFPIVGRVPYKGFFDLGEAEAEAQLFRERGYDTYIRSTSAFSTLGWLPDPLLSTALDRDSIGIVETVIHELTHNTLWVSGHVKFNESLANFVGSVGAIEFFCNRGYDAGLCQQARDSWHDRLVLGEFLDELWDGLENLYAEELELDELKGRREAFMQAAAEHFEREYVPSLRLAAYARFDPTQLNNASLIARHLYYHRLNVFQSLYKRVGSLTGSLDRLSAALEEQEDPWPALGELAGYPGLKGE